MGRSWSEIAAGIARCLESDDPAVCLRELFDETPDGMVAKRLGDVLMAAGDPCAAAGWYERAAGLFPRRLYVELARALHAQARARCDGTAAAVGAPEGSTAWEEVAEGIRRARAGGDPVADLTALHARGGDPHVARALGEELMALGDPCAAAEWFAAAADGYPMPSFRREAERLRDEARGLCDQSGS